MSCKVSKYDICVLKKETWRSKEIVFPSKVNVDKDKFTYIISKFGKEFQTTELTSIKNTIILDDPKLNLGKYTHELIWSSNDVDTIVFVGQIEVLNTPNSENCGCKSNDTRNISIDLINQTLSISIDNIVGGGGGISEIVTSNEGNVKFEGNGSDENPLFASVDISDKLNTPPYVESEIWTGFVPIYGEDAEVTGFKPLEEIQTPPPAEFIVTDYTDRLTNVGTIHGNNGSITTLAGYKYSGLIEVKYGDIIEYGVNVAASASSTAGVLIKYNAGGTFVSSFKKMTDFPAGTWQEQVWLVGEDCQVRLCTADANQQGVPYIRVKRRNNGGSTDDSTSLVMGQIFNPPFRQKEKTEKTKVLWIGSSFGMNAWWYLNKLTENLGLNVEFHCFYQGGNSFQNVIDAYNTNQSIAKYTSSNGSAWTSVSTPLKTFLQTQDFDVIIFQQGALQGIDWGGAYVNQWKQLIELLKLNCRGNTTIGYHSLWSPAINGYLTPYPQSKDGQKLFNAKVLENTLKTIQLTGVGHYIPNTQLIQLIRQDATLNIINDLATDNLHLDNGLGMYALSLGVINSYFSKIYNIDISEVTWLPDATTPKAIVSATDAFIPITTTQATLIKQYVRKSNINIKELVI